MLKVGNSGLEKMNGLYPGIRETVEYYESLRLPRCPACASGDTAKVSAGITSRSRQVAGATTRMRLIPSGHPADYFCNTCGLYFEV